MRFVGSSRERRKPTRALGAVLCLLPWTPGDAFADTTEATGTAPPVSTVHAAVGIEHKRMVELPYTREDPDIIDVAADKPHDVNTEDTDMKTRLAILVAVLCFLAYYSHTDGIAASNQFKTSELSGSKHRPQSNIFDPLGLVSASQHGQLVTLGAGFSFTEGPAVDGHGNVLFTDQPNDRIYRWDAGTDEITPFLEGTGRANGMAFDSDGNLIACADMHGEIWKIYPDRSHDVLVNNYGGKLLNGPNDVWINPVNGGMYITDPIFPRPYWDDADPRNQGWEPTHSEQSPAGKGGYVYYLPPGGDTLVRVTTEDMGWESDSWPNGVVGTPDGKKLYVNKWYYDNLGGTWVFDINPDGTLSNMQKFTEWGGDGMSMDELENVYISNGQGVMAFDPNGNNILRIPTGSGATNNMKRTGKLGGRII